MVDDYNSYFKGKNILITGGLGFIGSNLAHSLTRLEHRPKRIILVDSLIPGLGGNTFNIKGIEDKLETYAGSDWDLRNNTRLENLIKETDCIFNLAGSVSHTGSKENPLFDADINLMSHIHLLEICRSSIKNGKSDRLKIVFAGTRDQYGKVPEDYLPVKESSVKEEQVVFEAVDPQGIHKYAAEHHHLWYSKNFGIRAVSLRLTNTYGPRQQMKDKARGVLNWFIRQAIENKQLELWGGGRYLRDFMYIDDVVDAFLMAMSSDNTDGDVYNLGSSIKVSGKYEDRCGNVKTVGDIAYLITELAGTGTCIEKEYPDGNKSIEPGHFYADATKFHKAVGWCPRTSLREGLLKTIEFYKENRHNYW